MYSPLPIKEQITAALLNGLAAVVAGAAYVPTSGIARHFQVSLSVERAKITGAGNVPADLKCVLREGDDRVPTPADNIDDGGSPIRHQRWFRPYVATVYLSDADPTIPFDQKKNVVSDDVLNALLVDRGLGGLCDDLYPRGTTSFESGEDMPGIDINFEVLYTHAEDDCYGL